MKIIDKRDGRVMEGELITVLPAGQDLDTDTMRRFYKARPGDRNYDMLRRACPHPRFVLRRSQDEDISEADDAYYIVPQYEFYTVLEDTNG